ncbi:SHOCT domain-containing protein [Streptomyces sp. NPDC051563]|uniref:SHOCT domain-containing protein n=1 Tax=Streptomyces sp. NPDC051563 TaxID=3365659 RepID=UPI0037A145F9
MNPSLRPSGRPLLRGILARGAYVWDAAQRPATAAAAPQPQDGTPPPPASPAAPPSTRPGPPAAAPGPAPGAYPAPAPAPPAAPSGRREPAAARPAPRPGPVPASPGADLTDRLTQLAALAREGLLTPEEFSAAKARLLAD